jgi:hypothetical protein
MSWGDSRSPFLGSIRQCFVQVSDECICVQSAVTVLHSTSVGGDRPDERVFSFWALLRVVV